MREYIFSRSTWIVNTIEEMLKATSRPRQKNDAEPAEDDRDVPNEVEDEDSDGEEEEPLLDEAPMSGNISKLEHDINQNDAMRPTVESELKFHAEEMQIYACQTCDKRFLGLAMRIHINESHSIIAMDANDIDERAK